MNRSPGTFDDTRLDKRGHTPRMYGRAQNGVPQTHRRRPGWERAAGRFFANEKAAVERIVASWSDRTVSIATRDGQRRGLGQCGHGNAHGVLAHTMLAADKPVTKPLRLSVLAERDSRRWGQIAPPPPGQAPR